MLLNSGAVAWGTVLQAGRAQVRFSMVIGIIHRHNPFGCTMALGSTQPLTEMSTSGIFRGVKTADAWADNLTTFMCWLSWNLGASTFWEWQGLSRPVQGLIYLLLLKYTCRYVQGSFIFLYQWTYSVKNNLLVSSLYI
jgi:hypothetical protein